MSVCKQNGTYLNGGGVKVRTYLVKPREQKGGLTSECVYVGLSVP